MKIIHVIRLDQAVEHFEEGGLAGAVATDQTQTFAAAELEGDVVDGEELSRA
jgi:hypothetical protein